MKTYSSMLRGVLGLMLLATAGCNANPDGSAGSVRLAVNGDPAPSCVTIRRGVAGQVADTQIADNRPNESYGGMPVANAGRAGGGQRQTLVRADLGQIPANASIESATLTLWQSNTGEAVVEVHPVLAAWDESTVTWNSLAGAYAPEIVASAHNNGPTYEGPMMLDLTGLVQAWVSGAAENHGILLTQAGTAATRFRTGKAGNVAHRPALEVCYTEIRQPQGTSLFLEVVDTSGVPVPAALVTIDGVLRATDGAGRILLDDLAPGRIAAKVEARGYASASAVVDLHAGAHAGTQVRLMPLGEPVVFQAEAGAIIEQDAVRVVIPPGMLVDRNGEPVTGAVEATIVPFDPTSTSLANLPGPLEGVAAEDGQVVSLESLIMAEVSLWQDGLPLQLAPGAKATLTLPLPDSLAGEVEEGQMIPAWWFDLEAGLWRQEGEGMIQWDWEADKLVWVVEVAHFTWWNCDRPWTDKNCFSVTVVDALGNPVPDITIGATGVSYMGSSTPDVTEADGQACVDIMLSGMATLHAGLPSQPLATLDLIGVGPAGDCAGEGMGCIPVVMELPEGTVVCAPGTSRPCAYPGPAGTEGVGLCQAGTNSCNADGTAWSGCVGEIVPAQETCATPFDDDCDGQANEPEDGVGCACSAGDTTPCYTGRPETMDVGICQAGVRTCDTSIGRFGACMDQVVPQPEDCQTAEDEDCDGALTCGCTDGLAGKVACWPMDEISGGICADLINGYNGTWINSPTPTTGVREGALAFDGVDDHVIVLDTPDLNFGTGDFSIRFYVKTTSSGLSVILDKRTEVSGPVKGYAVYLNWGTIGLQLADGSHTNYQTSAFVADGQWHEVLLTVDRDQTDGIKVYLDTVLVTIANPTLRQGFLTTPSPLTIGRRSDNPGWPGFFYGDIDEIKIFDRVLTATEISSL